MAQTAANHWPPSVLVDVFVDGVQKFWGKRLCIPIKLTQEARARRDWDDAVAWLEARKAARDEWPWPER